MSKNKKTELTKDDIRENSGISEMLRVITYVLCIVGVFVIYPGEKSVMCIRSFYDKIMYEHDIVEKAIWGHLSMYLVLLFIVSATVLIINGVFVRSNKRMSAVIDIIFYLVLAISVPLYLVLVTRLNRAVLVMNKKTVFLIGSAVALILIAAYIVTKTIRSMRNKEQDKNIALLAFVLLLIVPVIPLSRALKEADEYKSSYGTYIAGKVTPSSESEFNMGNRHMRAREYEGKLYYCNMNSEICVIDNGGSETLVTVDEEDGWLTAFDIYEGKIYYSLVKDNELRIMCNDMNGSDVQVYSEPQRNGLWMLLIRDGVLYYDALGDNEIRYIDLNADTLVSDTYISDLSISMPGYVMLVYGHEDSCLGIPYNADSVIFYDGMVYYIISNLSDDLTINSHLYRSDSDTALAADVMMYTVYNDKIYYTCYAEENILRSMDLDGSNETIVAEFDAPVQKIYGASGQIYVTVGGHSSEGTFAPYVVTAV